MVRMTLWSYTTLTDSVNFAEGRWRVTTGGGRECCRSHDATGGCCLEQTAHYEADERQHNRVLPGYEGSQ